VSLCQLNVFVTCVTLEDQQVLAMLNVCKLLRKVGCRSKSGTGSTDSTDRRERYHAMQDTCRYGSEVRRGGCTSMLP
jgi:hypothetical protein